MTATIYRRLVDLPPGLLDAYPNARTTDDVIREWSTSSLIDDWQNTSKPTMVAAAIRDAAAVRHQRAFIAILSDPQCHWIGVEPGSPQAARIIRRMERTATATPLAQLVMDFSDRNIVPDSAGKPATVVVLWDGRIKPAVSHHARSRRDMRVTLDDDVLEWIDAESARRGDSRSSVVQDALRAAMK